MKRSQSAGIATAVANILVCEEQMHLMPDPHCGKCEPCLARPAIVALVQGEHERAMLVFEAKNRWANRARALMEAVRIFNMKIDTRKGGTSALTVSDYVALRDAQEAAEKGGAS